VDVVDVIHSGLSTDREAPRRRCPNLPHAGEPIQEH
jgi:hypothetical protein